MIINVNNPKIQKIIQQNMLTETSSSQPRNGTRSSLYKFAYGLVSQKWILIILYALLLPCVHSASVITVTSASTFVGVMTNYSVTITNHSNPRMIRTQFSAWSPWQSQPYGNSYQFYLTSGTFSATLLSCTPKFSMTTIECPLTAPLGNTIQLLMVNIFNPSSTKPYPITFIQLFADGTQQSITSSLTVPNVSSFTIGLSSYNTSVGASSSTNWILAFDYYFSFSTILRISYSSNLVSIGFGSLSGATTTSTSANGTTTVLLSNWTSTIRGNRILGTITITNPLAAISTSISGLLYFTQSSQSYSIQSYTASLSITPVAFTSITATSSLQLGLSAQVFSISSHACPYTPIDKSVTNTSYTQISYYTIDFIVSSCSASVSNAGNASKTCTYTTTTLPKTVTGITQAVTQQLSDPISVTVYTYFSALAAYYPLCSQVYNLLLIKQILSTTTSAFNTGSCGTGKTAQLNTNTVLAIRVESALAGDILTIYSLLGTVYNSTQWRQVANTTNYRYTLTSSNIINSTHVSVPLQYYNPTYLTSANRLTNITLSRVDASVSPSVQYIYAIIPSSTNASSTQIQLCTVTVAAELQSFTMALSSYVTYQQAVTASILFKNNIKDYTSNDYMRVWYKYYDGVLFLNTPALATSIRASLTTNTITTNNTVSIINNTLLHIYNISQINNVTASLNSLTISGLPNPATIYPSTSASGAFHIAVSLMSADKGIEKEQFVVKFSSNTTQTAYSYMPDSVAVVQSMEVPILVNLSASSPLTLSLSNNDKYKYYSNLSQSILSIKLPFTCTETDTSGTVTSLAYTRWNVFTNPFNIVLTNCQIGYINSSTAIVRATQSIGIDSSTTVVTTSSVTAYGLVLNCVDNCLECTSTNVCTRCVNSTYSPFTQLYEGQCGDVCPLHTYQPVGESKCELCHASCLSCTGAEMTHCLSCPQYFTNKSINISITQGITDYQFICVSVCGQNMYQNPATNKCQQCEIDCTYCTSGDFCYVCRNGASMVGYGLCDFVLCTQPCKSCEGQMTNCTSCIADKYLYQYQCYDKCPTNTYGTVGTTPSSSDKSINICVQLKAPTLYFPAVICSIVLIGLVCVCNTCIDRGLTADINRKSINMLTYSSSILAYMELFALFILLAFTQTKFAVGVGVAGLALWMLCNVLFAVYYCKVLRNDAAIMSVVAKMSSKSRCIYYTVLGLSMGVTLRTYRVLYCGLFRGVAPYSVKKKDKSDEQKDREKKRKGSQARIANEDINIKIQQSIQQQQSPKTKAKEKPNEIIKIPNKISVNNFNTNNGKNTSIMNNKTVVKNDAPLSPKKIVFQQPQIQNKIVSQQFQSSSMQSDEDHSKFELKRPYIIYITFGSIIGSILFLVAGLIEVIGNEYPAMLFWGLDLIIVVIASIIVTALDMWTGIKKSYLMALEKGNANQTMQNLRGEEDVDELTQQKILHNTKATQKISKRNSPMKKPVGAEAKPPIKKKYVPPVSLIKKSPTSPKSQEKVLSPQQKQAQEKINKLKKIKNRYNDLYKRSKKPDQESSSEQDNGELPDIKVFQDIQMYANDEIQPASRKAKKVKADHKRMSSMNSMRKANNRSNLNQSSNVSIGKSTKMNCKMDDIFLGFKQAEDDPNQFDKKTIKLTKNVPQRQSFNKKFQKSDESDQGDLSYINQLQRQKKQNLKNIKVEDVLQQQDNKQMEHHKQQSKQSDQQEIQENDDKQPNKIIEQQKN